MTKSVDPDLLLVSRSYVCAQAAQPASILPRPSEAAPAMLD